jgi:DNA-directed RNA polymerase II subunit RPB1
MEDVNFALNNIYNGEIRCVYSDYNSDSLVFRIQVDKIVTRYTANDMSTDTAKYSTSPLDRSDAVYILKNFQTQLLNNVILRGVKGLSKVIMRKVNTIVPNHKEGTYQSKSHWVLDTVGTNLIDVLGLSYIDKTRTFSNSITEIFDVLGIEAARQAIFNELTEAITSNGSYVNGHHVALLCDRMTHSCKIMSIHRHGINNDNIGPITKASFEETPEMFLRAARHGELDNMVGISPNIMVGQEGLFGTNAFKLILDTVAMQTMNIQAKRERESRKQMLELSMDGIDDTANPCSRSNLTIVNNVSSAPTPEIGSVAAEYTMDGW